MFQAKLEMLHPALQRLYLEWDGMRSGQAAPAARKLPMAALKPWHPNLAQIEVTGPGKYRYSFYGEALAAAFGVDFTGRSLDSVEPGRREMIAFDYDHCVKSRRPASRVYTAMFEEGEQTWNRLLLPLAGQDGTISTILLGAYQALR